jgi:hypothetical protein
MLTLSYGFKRPQTGDKGSAFFPALEDDIQQLNDHEHDGTDSARLTTASVEALTTAILAAGWVAQGGGLYAQDVNLPGSLLYDEIHITFKQTSNGNQLALGVDKVDGNTYTVYCTDNTLNVTAVYTS